MLYTHNWGLFLGVGLACALVPCWYVSEVRSSFWKDALLSASAAPACSTCPGCRRSCIRSSTPVRRWLNPPNFGAPVQISKSLLGGGDADRRARARRRLGLVAILQRRVEDKERTALIAGAVTVLGTLAIAWLVSQVSPAWTTRYLGVLLGPMLLIAALGLSRAGVLGLAALADHLRHLGDPATGSRLENKSNAADLRKAVVNDNLLREGDLVISMQPEQGPAARLPPREAREALQSCASRARSGPSRTTA